MIPAFHDYHLEPKITKCGDLLYTKKEHYLLNFVGYCYLASLKKVHPENKNFFLLPSHENKSKFREQQGFCEILMNTLVFSPKQHLPKHMQHSVCMYAKKIRKKRSRVKWPFKTYSLNQIFSRICERIWDFFPINFKRVKQYGHYGNTSCGVFKGRIQNQKGFWLKINCSQMKVLNFENWSSGELSKIGHHFRK